MRRWDKQDDAGQAMSMLLIPIAAGLVFLGLTFMIGFGDGTRSRTQSGVAADAAALAAATAWQREAESRFEAFNLDPAQGFPELRDFLALPSLEIGAEAAESRARLFARRNDAELVSFSVETVPGAVQYRVRTRSIEPAKQTGVFTFADAVARVRLDSGLCFTLSGARVNLERDGNCPEIESSPPIAEIPEELAPLKVTSVLVE